VGWVESLLKAITKVLIKSSTTVKIPAQEPLIAQEPIPAIELPKDVPSISRLQEPAKVEIDWKAWAKEAAHISSTYEGKGGDYANITGNFDGAYLTCGLLGLTWKYSNQIKIIDKYLKRHGPNPLLKLMPKTGQKYLEAVNAGVRAGAIMVSEWSNGAKVYQPYKKELEAFWSSPEMIALQDETYEEMMGIFAKKKCLETQAFFGLAEPQFEHYAYWWDQAVLNGQGSTVGFEEAKNFSSMKVLDFVGNIGGYNKSSNVENYKIWAKAINTASLEQLHLFKMAYLRSLKSRKEFMGTTLMRRGTLALGIGCVNEQDRKYDWYLG
jgi:hypothetical protein